MRNSLVVLVLFIAGLFLGRTHLVGEEWLNGDIITLILYVLICQIGISIGSHKDLKAVFTGLRPGVLLLPLFTVFGTLSFTLLGGLLLSQWTPWDYLAVGSGFGYYSLSSVLIAESKESSLGLQLATELGTLALLTNIMRELIALLGIPFFVRYFGKFAAVSAAGITSMDATLPLLSRYAGKDVVPLAILHGVVLEISVPFLVSFFCSI